MRHNPFVFICALALLSAAGAPLRAQDSNEENTTKCAGGGPGVKCGPTSIVFPFKEEIEKKKIASELKCVNGKEKDGKLMYEKCRHKTFEKFDEVALKLKLVSAKEKLAGFDKEKLKRCKQLAALHSAKKNLKEALKDSMAKGEKEAAGKEFSKKLAAADEKIKDDLKKAVSACKKQDAADMDCDAKFPEED